MILRGLVRSALSLLIRGANRTDYPMRRPPHCLTPASAQLLFAISAILTTGCYGDVPYAAVESESTQTTPARPAVLARLTPGSFTLVALPDTQYYAQSYPEIFRAQTQWIADHAQALSLRYVLHLGDIVETNAAAEWRNAADALGTLDAHKIPYAIVPGNHDYGPGGTASNRETLMNDYLSFEAAERMPSFGGVYENGKLDNTFHLFSAGGRDFILLALEWGPRDEVVAWASSIMSDYPERLGILITHAYLNEDDSRDDITDDRRSQRYNPHSYFTLGSVNDGEELWQKLVRHHRFIMTLNGHVLGDGTGYLISRTDVGNDCHQMLSNFQLRERGGEGYLRVLEFLPDGRSVHVYTYSVLFDRLLESPDQELVFEMDI